jgi:hypothetical protein
MASGNPAETWGEDGLKDEAGQPIRQPRQINRSCLSAPGNEMELTDDAVYFCNRWDPMTPRELRRREKPQQRHLKMHPELAALQPTALDLDDHDEEESHGAR